MKIRLIINSIAMSACVILLGSNPAGAFITGPPRDDSAKLPSAAPKTNRIIIKYRDNAVPSAEAKTAIATIQTLSRAVSVNLQFVRHMASNTQVVKLDGFRSLAEVEAIVKQLANDPDILYAEPDTLMQLDFVPSDPRYNEQWHYFELEGGINLPEAWDTTTGKNVVVAVIDTGITSHEDLQGQVLPGYDFISDALVANDGDGRDDDPNDEGDWVNAGDCGDGVPTQNQPSSWHGTHIAGTIAARTNNEVGVAGIAWNAKILPVRVAGKCGAYVSDIVDGMRWAVGLDVEGVPHNPNPAQILNLSLGTTGRCTPTFTEAIDAVRARGVTIVAAAGNENEDAGLHSPASCPGVISVAATRRDGGRAYYSNFGPTVDVSAPGGELFDSAFRVGTASNGVLSTLNSGQTEPGTDTYDFYQGTSMATPHVAGVAALLYAVNPDLDPEKVESILKKTARSFPLISGNQCDSTRCGAGIIDAAAAVQEAVNGDNPAIGESLGGRNVNSSVGARPN